MDHDQLVADVRGELGVLDAAHADKALRATVAVLGGLAGLERRTWPPSSSRSWCRSRRRRGAASRATRTSSSGAFVKGGLGCSQDEVREHARVAHWFAPGSSAAGSERDDVAAQLPQDVACADGDEVSRRAF